ncbi:MAG: hypothetical protein JW751_30615 [Polyangiaceae bacterium]|nr:hypothetical protein [Polyangiaceae bacterium]
MALTSSALSVARTFWSSSVRRRGTNFDRFTCLQGFASMCPPSTAVLNTPEMAVKTLSRVR